MTLMYHFNPYCMLYQICFCRSAIALPGPLGQVNNVKSKSISNPRWRRVVFKVSGVALAGTGPNNIDPKVWCNPIIDVERLMA